MVNGKEKVVKVTETSYSSNEATKVIISMAAPR
jgi:hypothetical protein